MSNLLKTSLYERHVQLNAKMAPFANYSMPISYNNGIKHECLEVRNNVGVFDVSHMGVFKIQGSQCDSFLNNILSNDILSMKNGKAMYTLLCNLSGGIIDDLIVYKLDNYFILIVNASNKEKDFNWIRKKCPKDIILEDISLSTSLIAVQGPNSKTILDKILNINLNLGFYSCSKKNYKDKEIFIARTGYTGELGYEILGDIEAVNQIWDALISSHVSPIGLAVRDILRIEMGYCLYGHEIDEKINPIDAGLSWIVDKKLDFIGDKEVFDSKNHSNKLIYLKTLDRGIPRQGIKIYLKNNQIGFVTSGTFSYTLNYGIGIGYVKKNIKSYENAFILIRDKKIPIGVSSKPYILNSSLRK